MTSERPQALAAFCQPLRVGYAGVGFVDGQSATPSFPGRGRAVCAFVLSRTDQAGRQTCTAGSVQLSWSRGGRSAPPSRPDAILAWILRSNGEPGSAR